MQEENNIETTDALSLNRWLRLITITVLSFVTLIAIYMYLFIYGGWGTLAAIFSPAPAGEPDATLVLPDLDGKIFISALTDDSENFANFVPIVVLPSSNSFVYAPIDQLASGAVLSLQHVFSADSARLTFLGWPLEEEYPHQTAAVYRANSGNREDSTYNDVIESIQNTATMTLEPDEEDYFRQGPVISLRSDIVYSSLAEAEFDPEPAMYGSVPANEWTIYRLDVNNQRYTLTNGLAPKWIDNTRFIFLKNDGVYLYNIATNEEKMLWNLNFVPSLINAFDVSDDGRMVAISNPKVDIVTIIKNSAWEGDSPVGTAISEVSGRISGLTFAPNNSYLAMFQLVGTNNAGTEGFARLTYYALDAGVFHEKFVDLEDPQLQGLYMNDWK